MFLSLEFFEQREGCLPALLPVYIIMGIILIAHVIFASLEAKIDFCYIPSYRHWTNTVFLILFCILPEGIWNALHLDVCNMKDQSRLEFSYATILKCCRFFSHLTYEFVFSHGFQFLIQQILYLPPHITKTQHEYVLHCYIFPLLTCWILVFCHMKGRSCKQIGHLVQQEIFYVPMYPGIMYYGFCARKKSILVDMALQF